MNEIRDFKLIACVDCENGIGHNGKLLYHIPEDMVVFNRLTKGNVIIMGKRTFLSLPRKLPLIERVNIVISSDPLFTRRDCIVSRSIEEAMDQADQFKHMKKYVIGGESIYKQFMPYSDSIYLTKIYNQAYMDQKADTFFPSIDKSDWSETFSSPLYISHNTLKEIFGKDYKRFLTTPEWLEPNFPCENIYTELKVYKRNSIGK